MGMYSLRPRDIDWFRRGMIYDTDLSHERDEEMYSMFVCHHVLAKWCGLHVHVYGVTSDPAKELFMICEIYKIVIERTEILAQ